MVWNAEDSLDKSRELLYLIRAAEVCASKSLVDGLNAFLLTLRAASSAKQALCASHLWLALLFLRRTASTARHLQCIRRIRE